MNKGQFYCLWLFKRWQKRYQDNSFAQPFKPGEGPFCNLLHFLLWYCHCIWLVLALSWASHWSWALIIWAGRMGGDGGGHYWLLLKFSTPPPFPPRWQISKCVSFLFIQEKWSIPQSQEVSYNWENLFCQVVNFFFFFLALQAKHSLLFIYTYIWQE